MFSHRSGRAWVARRRLIPPIFAFVFALAGATSAFAWTQLFNNYPNAPTSCTDTSSWPCIEWAKTGSNLSITAEVYLNSSLTLGVIDLHTDVRNSFPEWNNIAARNPHLQETTSTTSDEVYAWAGVMPDGIYAGTTDSYQGSQPYHITHADIEFNSNVAWNRLLDFSVTYPEPGTTLYHADARKVANHEMGHAEGLGHTGINPAIMRQGATTYYHVQSNDAAGIVAVYGAYP